MTDEKSHPTPEQLWDWLRKILANDLLQSVTGDEEANEAIDSVYDEMRDGGFGWMLIKVTDDAEVYANERLYSKETRLKINCAVIEFAIWSQQTRKPS